MDADSYVVEYMIRDRMIEARARAREAALRMDAKGSQGSTNGVWMLTEEAR